MTEELIFIRLLHIVPGVFWAGSAMLMAWVLEPAFRRMGEQAGRQARLAVSRAMGPLQTGAAVITVLVGLALIARMPGRGFGDLFTTGWGWAIGMGLVVSLLAIAAAAVGGVATAKERRMSEAGEATEASAAESRARLMSHLHAALALVAVATMAMARFV